MWKDVEGKFQIRCSGQFTTSKSKLPTCTLNVFSKFQELLRDSKKFRMGDVAEDDHGLTIQIRNPNSSRVCNVSVSKDSTSYSC